MNAAPQEIASAYITLKTVGMERVKKDLAYVKTALAESTKGVEQFNARLQTTTKLATFTQSRFRELFTSVAKLAGIKLPEKEVSVKADGLDKIEAGLAKLKEAAAVKIEKPESVKTPVKAEPTAPKINEPAPANATVIPPEPIKPTVEKPEPIKAEVVAPDPVKATVIPPEAVTPKVETPAPVKAQVVANGIQEIQSALAALKAPKLSVEARANGIAQIQSAIDSLKPHAVDVPILAQGLSEIQDGLNRLKPVPVVVPVSADTSKAKADVDAVKGHPVALPVQPDPKASVGFKTPSMGIPVALQGIGKATASLGILKSKIASAASVAATVPALKIMAADTRAAIDGFGRLKASIGSVLDRATDVPALRQLKSGIAFVNTKFDDFLKNRYGALAKPIKYSGMAVDMAMMAAGHPIPGGAILGTIPGIAAAEGHKQVTDYMQRRRDRQAKGEAPTLLDKGVNAVGAGASAVGNLASKGFAAASSAAGGLISRIKSIPYGSILSGLKGVGLTALSVFGSAAGAVSGFLGKLNGSLLDSFGNKIKEVGKAVSASISSIGSVAASAFAVLSGAIGATVRLADPLGWLNFTTAIQSVTIQIGRIFIPLLHQVTGYLAQVDRFLRNLTDAQREQILSWVKIAVVVSGSVVAFTQLFGVLSSGFGILSSFVGILTALGVSGPVGWIIAIGAAIAGLVAIVASSSGGFTGLFAGIQPLLTGLVQACRNAFDAIAPIVQTVLGGISGLIQTALGAVTPFVAGLASLVSSTLGQLAGIVQPLLQTIFGSANGNFARVAGAVRNTLAGLLGILSAWAENIVALWRSVAPELGGVFKALFDIWGDYATYVQGVIQSLMPSIKTFIGLVYSVAVPILTAAVAAVRGYLEALRPIFASLFDIGKSLWDAFGQIADSLMQAIKPLTDAFGSSGGFLAAFNAALQVILLPLRLLAWLLALAVPVVRFFVDGLVATVQLCATLLRPVIDLVVSQFMLAVECVRQFAAVTMATVEMLKEISRNPAVLGSQAGVAALGQTFRLEYQRQIQVVMPRPQRPEADSGGGGGSWGEGEAETTTNRFTGTVLQKSELTSIASAWAKAQTADPNDPQVRLLNLQLNQAERTNTLLEQIAAQGGGGGNWGFGA
jgi:phage-related protein